MSLLALAQCGTHPILQQIQLNFVEPQLVMLVGPNGAGKSTLIQHLAGIQQNPALLVSWHSQATDHFTAKDWAKRVSFLPQLSHTGFALTVAEVVELGAFAQNWNKAQRQERLQQALVLWELVGFAQRDMRTLSGGEQQRVHLARCWLQIQAEDCQGWLLDEPFSALDLRHQALCLQEMKRLVRLGKTIVLVVHDLNLARTHAERVILMQQGKIVADGQAKVVLNAKQVATSFELPVSLEGNYLRW